MFLSESVYANISFVREIDCLNEWVNDKDYNTTEMDVLLVQHQE